MTIRTLTGLALGIGLLLLTGPSALAAVPTTPSSPAPATAPALASITTALPDKMVDHDSIWFSYDVNVPSVTAYVILSCQPSTSRAAWRVSPVKNGRATIPNVVTKNLGWPVEIVGYTGRKVMARSGCVSWTDDVTAFGSQYVALETGGPGGGGKWGSTGTSADVLPILAPADANLSILPGESVSKSPAFAVPTTDPTVIDAPTTAAAADPTGAVAVAPGANAAAPTPDAIALTPAEPSDEVSHYSPIVPMPTGVYLCGALLLLLAAVSSRRLAKDRAEAKGSSPLDWTFVGVAIAFGLIAAYNTADSSVVSGALIIIVLGIVAGVTAFSRIGGMAARLELKYVPRYARNPLTVATTAAGALVGWAIGANETPGLLYGAIVGAFIGAGITGRRIVVKKAAERAALAGRLAGCFGGSTNDWVDGSIVWRFTEGGGLIFRPGAQQVGRLGAGFEDRAETVFPEYVVVSATSTEVVLGPVDGITAARREHLAASGGLVAGVQYAHEPAEVEPITVAPAGPSMVKGAAPAPTSSWSIVEIKDLDS